MDKAITYARWLIAILLIPAFLMVWPECAEARREHIVYFENTPHELNIYKIYGRKDGPTIMIIGGIQGDEPGGFLSADLYTDLALKKGNLIVVPRANFNSILLFKRGPNGDMNRKFGGSPKGDHESQIVRILEELISESDLLLNLHDGWGFFRPKYESKMANPMRYGQSVIADADVFKSKKGRKLELKKLATQAIRRINDDIDNPKYHFHFMNTRTDAKDSPYSEQKTSATYYALTRFGIPAFGVETSKNLPTIEMKVEQHNLAVNAFMEIFGLEIDIPPVHLDSPKLSYMIISVNNQMPVAVADGETLYCNPGDQIEIVHIEANYERGLSADIHGLGSINDYRQKFRIRKATSIVAQKDHLKFGRVSVDVNPAQVASVGVPVIPKQVLDKTAKANPDAVRPKPAPPKTGPFRVTSFIVEVEGKKKTVPAGGQLVAKWGDRIKVVDIRHDGKEPGKRVVVNFKGFVGDKSKNTGEDRGYVIHTSKDLMARYSLSKKEKIYEVVVEEGKKPLAKMTFRLERK